MSDGMSDSRAYDSDHEKWTEVEDVKLAKPIDVFFWHFRDGVQAECILLGIEFFCSRWGGVSVELPDGGAAVAFVGRDSLEMAKDAMKKLMVKKLKTDRYSRYVRKD